MDETRTTSESAGLVAIVFLVVVAAGCTGTGADPVRRTSYVDVDCPSEIRTATNHVVTCGYLTVPEDRSNPEGRRIRLFVFRIEPDIPSHAVPVVYVGDDLGSSFDLPATVGMADHLDGPEVIALEMRGTGYSEPNLSCPEVEAISHHSVTASIEDKDLRRAFLDAVKACHDRLVAQGVDLSAYGVEEAGADILDLAQTLGLETWDVISKGSTSRVVFETMRASGSGLRAVVLYNPEFPDTDPYVEAFRSTRASIDHLDALCQADAACSRSFPNVVGSVNEAVRRFDRHPAQIEVAGTRIAVDGARLLRGIRNLLASIRPDGKTYLHLPATFDALAHARDPITSLAAVVSPEIAASTFCVGFLPTCTRLLSDGSYYSVLCRDILPFADVDSLEGLARGEAAWIKDYARGPYEDVCDVWTVAPAERSVASTSVSDLPVLVYSGSLDPFVNEDAVREGIEGLPGSFVVESSVQSHPVVVPAECQDDDSRVEFLADPTTAPSAPCLERFEPVFAMSPL